MKTKLEKSSNIIKEINELKNDIKALNRVYITRKCYK